MAYKVIHTGRKKRGILRTLLSIILLLAVLAAGWQVALRTLLYPVKYDALVERYSAEYGLDASFVYAVINCESSFNPKAVSKADARGLMQLTPETFGWLQTKTGESLPDEALFEPEVGIKYGCLLLSLNLKEFGNTAAAVAAYHAGRSRVASWLKDKKYSEDGHSLSSIPYKETNAYVKNVIKKQEKYRQLYGLE